MIFDLDGTMIDSLQDLVLAVNLTLEELGHPKRNDTFIQNAVGNGARKLLETCLPTHQVADDQTYELFMSYYNSNCSNQTEVYPGVVDFLEKTAHLKKAILTNKPIAPTMKIITSLGLDHFFELVYGGDSFPHQKPHPMGLQTILQSFHISATQAMMIGDGFQDIRAANAVGMDSIAIINRIGKKAALLREKPTYLVQNFQEISAMFSTKK